MESDSSKITGRAVRRIVLRQSKRANVGHIGSALSVADIVAVLYDGVLRASGPDDADRDRFVLSKGHAALSLYAALALRGWINPPDLDQYCADGSLLGVHVEHTLTGVDFSTGSLGHGLSIGAGAALAARLAGSARRAYVLLSDAELNEGSLWEAVMFAAHQKLANLIAVIDLNGQQALGATRDVLDLEPLAEKWNTFGWWTITCDGHDEAALTSAFEEARNESSTRPRVILARTICGGGVSFMERLVKWHYWPMSDAEFAQACAEIEVDRSVR